MSWIANIFTGIGSMKAGEAQKEYGYAQAEARRAVATENIRKAEVQAKYLKGRQRLAYAAAGVEIESGSPLEMMAYTAGEAARDIAWMKWSRDVEHKFGRLQAKMQEKTTKLYGWSGAGAGAATGISGFIGGGTGGAQGQSGGWNWGGAFRGMAMS